MSGSEDFLKTPVWYPVLASHTFLTSFVRLRPEAVKALADGCDGTVKSAVVIEAIESLRAPMAAIPGHCFASVDCCSPTDTERFITKGGAVFSPESAWRYLARSAKVRAAAERGDVEYICLRPFRRMNRTREFRLFIRNGELNAMSQYHLTRHFRRLEGIKENLWSRCQLFINAKSWRLPKEPLVMDIYFTSNYERIMIVDLNPWSGETDPKLFKWDEDWDSVPGLRLMAAPAEN